MKENSKKVKEYSIDEFNSIVSFIKTAKGITDEDISIALSPNDGYIVQTRSRGKKSGKVSAKLITALINQYNLKIDGQGKITMAADLATMVKEIAQLKAVTTVLLSHVAELEKKTFQRIDSWERMDEEARTILRGLPSLA